MTDPIIGLGWAPVNDCENMIATDHVGATESQASKSFISGWPGGWDQAKAAGWRLSRVKIMTVTDQEILNRQSETRAAVENARLSGLTVSREAVEIMNLYDNKEITLEEMMKRLVEKHTNQG